ncbi:protein Rpn4p [Monosporozyma unispora]
MSFADFELKRTLTDVLEDELYHLPSTTKNPTMEQSTELIDLDGPILDVNSTQNLITDNDPLLSQSFTTTATNSNNNTIFSSYADPTLTVSSTSSPEPTNMVAPSPASSVESQQKTVNLNSLIKKKPYPTTTTTNTNTPHNNLLDVKISHDNTLYSPIVDDNEYMLYYDELYTSKLATIPLHDNSNALNMENAKVMFDQEFSDDDEEDDDDDNVFDEGHGNNMSNNNMSSRFSIPNDYPVYYMNDIREPTPNELDSSAIIDDDEEDENELDHSGLLNEDQLYNIMIRDNNKPQIKNNIFHNKRKLQHNNTLYSHSKGIETLVFNNDLMNLNRSKSLSLKQKPKLTVPSTNGNHLDTIIRKPLSHVNNNTTQHNLDLDTTNQKKKKLHTSTPRSKFTTNSNNNNPNEIFTCRLVNLITNEPCMAQFSRSYDLTRHQNTIHAKKKIVFRCSECIKSLGHDGYSKTFSRLDALTRHIKSKHEDLTPEQRQVVTKYAKENIGYVM